MNDAGAAVVARPPGNSTGVEYVLHAVKHDQLAGFS